MALDSGAMALKRSRDPNSILTPSRQPPPSKKLIIPPPEAPQHALELVRVLYTKTVQENKLLMEQFQCGQEKCKVVEGNMAQAQPPQDPGTSAS